MHLCWRGGFQQAGRKYYYTNHPELNRGRGLLPTAGEGNIFTPVCSWGGSVPW